MEQQQIRHHVVELAAAGTHLASVGSHLLFVQIAGLQRIGEFGQSLSGAQQLLGHIGNKRVTHLSETNHITDIGNQHDDELLVDTPYSHLQPVGAVDGLRGDVIALVLSATYRSGVSVVKSNWRLPPDLRAS